MDSMDLVKMIKKAAIEAVNASKPANIVFGKVTSANPLSIQIDQKLTLGKAQLVVSEHLTDHVVSVDVNWETVNTGGGSGEASFASHKHNITGNKTITVHNALAVGDKVILMQIAGGQKYVVIDRIGGV